MLQEAEETKENVINQFRDLETAKSEVETQQRPLLEEANRIKTQIDAFESKRNDLTVSRSWSWLEFVLTDRPPVERGCRSRRKAQPGSRRNETGRG